MLSLCAVVINYGVGVSKRCVPLHMYIHTYTPMHTHTTPTQRDGSNFTSTIIVAASASIGAIFIILTGMKCQHKDRLCLQDIADLL